MYPVADNAPTLEFALDHLDRSIEALGGDAPVSKFGLRALDELLGGVYPSQICAIGATPGSGKTTLLLQIADSLAAEGHPVIFVSCELSEPKLLQKSLSRIAGQSLPLHEVVGAASPGHPWHETFLAAVERYRETIAPNLAVTGALNITELGHLVAACKSERKQAPVVLVDYLQLMACGNPANAYMDERLAIAACVQGLRDISTLYGSPIFTVSTITRTAYSAKSPNLGVFGGSSAVEYSVDAALYLTRDDEKPDLPFDAAVGTPLKLVALKNRYGSLGTAKLDFDAEHATFRDRR